MSWQLKPHGRAVVVTMQSNPVNKMNEGFFRDLDEAWDELDAKHPHAPVVLTAPGKVFSAGLDFEDVFPRFARADPSEVWAWFERFSGVILRVFRSERPLVAALNGHSFAGGMVLALCCERRLAAAGPARYSLNEVAIGIPFPSVFIEMIRYAIGDPATTESMLTAQVYGETDALRLGMVHRLVPPGQLIDDAVAEAERIPAGGLAAYARTKASLLAPTLERIMREGFAIDRDTMRVIVAPESARLQAEALARLKSN
jgi:enoyl-CoA hydratase